MKLTLKQLVSGAEALDRLGNKKLKELTAKVFHDVTRNIRLTQPELETYNKVIAGLRDKYSTDIFSPEHKGNIWGVPAKNGMALTKEVEERLAVEVDLDIHPLHLTDEIIENAGITASDLFLLDWMIVQNDSDNSG